MKKSIVTLAMGLLFVLGAQAQDRSISGKVTDEKGSPIAGASVATADNKYGTQTNSEGIYSLSLPAAVKTLVFSSVNYEPSTKALGKLLVLNVTLTSVDKSLSEVVVVGYGTQKKKDITASVASIGGDKIKNIPVQSFEQALAGKASGLNITIPNGVLNNPPVVRIRGVNSINGSSFPLVVIDGIPVNTGDASTNLSANNALGNINPSDIEDIQVLKDAAAAAIYGSRAANGVMLITTKKGKAGKAKINYDGWVGWTQAFNIFSVLNASEYITIKNEAIKNGNFQLAGGPAAGSPLFFMDTLNGKPVDTRWSDYIYQTGVQHAHNISISGANEGTRYYFSANYTKQEGVLQTNTFERKLIKMNIEQKVSDRLKITGDFNYSRGTTFSPTTGSLPGTNFNTGGNARLAFVTAPNVSPYTATGDYNIIGLTNASQRNSFNQIGRNRNLDRSGFYNPVLMNDLNRISSESDLILGSISADYKISKTLSFRTQYGVNYQTVDDRTFYNAIHGDGLQTTATTDDGTAFNALGKYNTTTFQNTFTYNTSIDGKHNINVLAGSEQVKSTSDRWSAKRSGLTENFYNEFQGSFTINDNPNANLITENYLTSYFGRINYNFNNRYYVSGNLRRDGYSAFADGKKWGTFGGVSLGWNLSDEKFWTGGIKRVINSLKLRGSFGTVGSLSAVGNFSSLALYNSAQYGNGYPTLGYVQAENKNLTWESSNKKDFGFQFGLFNNRITGDVSYYQTDLTDLIIDVPTPPSLGIPNNSISTNSASMYNKGVELNLNFKIIDKEEFSWNTTLNFTSQSNKVTALASTVPQIIGFTSTLERTNVVKVDYAIGSLFAIRTNGVDPATGQRIFLDASGREVLFDFSQPSASRYKYRDGSIAPAIDLSKDGVIAGNALPEFYGGFINSISYKAFDLNIDMIYSFGNKVYFGSRAGLLDQRFWNNGKEVLTRWQKPGDITSVPRVVYNDNISNGSTAALDANIFSGDFVKCRSIAFGYTFPESITKRMKISGLRFYTQVTNPFVITSYPGSDPEISSNGNTAVTPGVDRNSIGQARTITMGLNLGF